MIKTFIKMKNTTYTIGIFLLLASMFIGCQNEDFTLGEIVTPSNVMLEFNVVGQDNENPYGDGSGLVNFTASADNAITYKYIFGDGTNDEVAPLGTIQHQFTKTGDATYIVTVIAYGTAGVSSSSSTQVTVNSAFEDPEAMKFLSGENVGDGKTWYWAYNVPLFVGLGPLEGDYGNGDFAWESWWNSIQPYDAEKSCMFDDEFVFTRTENGLTFEQTSGPAYIPGAYADVIGVAGETCHGEDVVTTMYGVKNISFFPSTSKAALEGSYNQKPYRGTSFNISLGGFMGWYVGSSTYDIIYITEDEMEVRVIQAGSPYSDGGYAWYQKFTSIKPD